MKPTPELSWIEASARLTRIWNARPEDSWDKFTRCVTSAVPTATSGHFLINDGEPGLKLMQPNFAQAAWW